MRDGHRAAVRRVPLRGRIPRHGGDGLHSGIHHAGGHRGGGGVHRAGRGRRGRGRRGARRRGRGVAPAASGQGVVAAKQRAAHLHGRFGHAADDPQVLRHPRRGKREAGDGDLHRLCADRGGRRVFRGQLRPRGAGQDRRAGRRGHAVRPGRERGDVHGRHHARHAHRPHGGGHPGRGAGAVCGAAAVGEHLDADLAGFVQLVGGDAGPGGAGRKAQAQGRDAADARIVRGVCGAVAGDQLLDAGYADRVADVAVVGHDCGGVSGAVPLRACVARGDEGRRMGRGDRRGADFAAAAAGCGGYEPCAHEWGRGDDRGAGDCAGGELCDA